MTAQSLAALAVAYLLGAIPFGLLVARIKGAGDIRQQGSGNIGATNVLRVAGRKAGALALLLDMGKGALAVALVAAFFDANDPILAATVLAVFLGHLYPVYLRFKGGKGVAVALGALLVWIPLSGLMMVATWLLTMRLFRISSLAALIAFGLSPLSLLFVTPPPLAGESYGLIILLIFWKHRHNIQRLLAGTEPTIGGKKTPPDSQEV